MILYPSPIFIYIIKHTLKLIHTLKTPYLFPLLYIYVFVYVYSGDVTESESDDDLPVCKNNPLRLQKRIGHKRKALGSCNPAAYEDFWHECPTPPLPVLKGGVSEAVGGGVGGVGAGSEAVGGSEGDAGETLELHRPLRSHLKALKDFFDIFDDCQSDEEDPPEPYGGGGGGAGEPEERVEENLRLSWVDAVEPLDTLHFYTVPTSSRVFEIGSKFLLGPELGPGVKARHGDMILSNGSMIWAQYQEKKAYVKDFSYFFYQADILKMYENGVTLKWVDGTNDQREVMWGNIKILKKPVAGKRSCKW